MFEISINPFKSQQPQQEIITELHRDDVIEYAVDGDLNNIAPALVVAPNWIEWDANGKAHESVLVFVQGGKKKKISVDHVLAVYTRKLEVLAPEFDAAGNYRGMATTTEAAVA